jgi:hypothetical protein
MKRTHQATVNLKKCLLRKFLRTYALYSLRKEVAWNFCLEGAADEAVLTNVHSTTL